MYYFQAFVQHISVQRFISSSGGRVTENEVVTKTEHISPMLPFYVDRKWPQSWKPQFL